VIDPKGLIKCIYGEAIPLHQLGELSIRRASHVEPDAKGRWWGVRATSVFRQLRRK